MATPDQIAANRSNALASTGPRSPDGKARSSKNALKHGLLSRELLLPGENPRRLKALRESVTRELAPVGALESALVERIVDALWRLGRARRVETSLFALRYIQVEGERAQADMRAHEHYSHNEISQRDLLDQLAADPTDSEATEHLGAIVRVNGLREQERSDETLPGAAFVRDVENETALLTLSRYESGIERSLYRALREFHRLQALRATDVTPLADSLTE